MFGIKKWLKKLIDKQLIPHLQTLADIKYNIEELKVNREEVRKKLKSFYDEFTTARYASMDNMSNLRADTHKSETDLGTRIKLLEDAVVSVQCYIANPTASEPTNPTQTTTPPKNALNGAYMGLIDQGNNIFAGIFYTWIGYDHYGGYRIEAVDINNRTYFFDYYEEEFKIVYGESYSGYSKESYVKSLLEAEQLVSNVIKVENLKLKEENILNQTVNI